MHFAVKSLAASIVLLASAVHAADGDASTRLEQSRAAANAHFKAAASSLVSAREALEKANAAFRSCRNGVLQLQFSESLARLESARKTLEKGRRETQAFRRKLEAVRETIESSHKATTRRHRGEVATEQSYAERLLTGYVAPFETQLVPLVEAYGAGITDYSASLDRYAQVCAKPGLTAADGRAFVSELSPSIDALATKASELVTKATQGADSATALK